MLGEHTTAYIVLQWIGEQWRLIRLVGCAGLPLGMTVNAGGEFHTFRRSLPRGVGVVLVTGQA
jgi:hypothetical protein